MPRRRPTFEQANIARILRAYRSAGVENVRTRWLPDGSLAFEPFGTETDSPNEAPPPESAREIVL